MATVSRRGTRLDHEDRAALAQLGVYVLLFGLCLLMVLVFALTAGLAVRLFEMVS